MNSRFKIFLSGGITGLNDEDCKKWREYIVKYFSNWCFNETDYIIVNQMKHFDPNKETSDLLEKEAMRYNLHHLRTSNIVIVNLNKLESIGTAQELMLAYELNIPIIGFIDIDKKDKIHPWIQIEVTKLFTYIKDIEEALVNCMDYVYNYYLNA